MKKPDFFKIGEIKYDEDNFKPYREVTFKWTPDMNADIIAHSYDGRGEVLKKLTREMAKLVNYMPEHNEN